MLVACVQPLDLLWAGQDTASVRRLPCVELAAAQPGAGRMERRGRRLTLPAAGARAARVPRGPAAARGALSPHPRLQGLVQPLRHAAERRAGGRARRLLPRVWSAQAGGAAAA
eukprot:6199922-Pleurochrysis_carterae.AAC.6